MPSKLIQNGINPDSERAEYDYYATDPKATELLLKLESFNNLIWEPCAGGGHMSDVLERNGYKVSKSDIVSRRKDIIAMDFLRTKVKFPGDIITNPPYKGCVDFVRHALDCVDNGAKVAMFLKITFLETSERRKLFDEHPPKFIYVASKRLKCVKYGDFQTPQQSAICFAWFIWYKGFTGEPTLRWFN